MTNKFTGHFYFRNIYLRASPCTPSDSPIAPFFFSIPSTRSTLILHPESQNPILPILPVQPSSRPPGLKSSNPLILSYQRRPRTYYLKGKKACSPAHFATTVMKLFILIVATLAVLAPVLGAPPSPPPSPPPSTPPSSPSCPCKFFELDDYDGSSCPSHCHTIDATQVDTGKTGKTCCNATTETDPETERFVLGNANGGKSTNIDGPSSIKSSDKQVMDNLSTKCYRRCWYRYYCFFYGGKYYCYYRYYCRYYC